MTVPALGKLRKAGNQHTVYFKRKGMWTSYLLHVVSVVTFVISLKLVTVKLVISAQMHYIKTHKAAVHSSTVSLMWNLMNLPPRY